MASGSGECSSKSCSKSRKCSKENSHVGKCDSKRDHTPFWQKSVFFKLKNQQGELSSNLHDIELKKAKIDLAEAKLQEKQDKVSLLVAVAEDKVAAAKCDLEKYITEKEVAEQKVMEEQQKLSTINKQYDKLKTLFECKDQSQTR
ncbi:Hypothetical predicted protein [Paramuricea clavata]|uniref:Uncharacterized protein n=1 Tax=Paramuricea clavata TaxID=317549 RepID=A0A6S7GK34_PARCT|nr:Hypothetical predicted protein [Paramuricea clavata]